MQYLHQNLRRLKPTDRRRFLRYCLWLKACEILRFNPRMIPFYATLAAGIVFPVLLLFPK